MAVIVEKNKKKAALLRSKYSPIGLDLGSAMIKMIQLHNQRGKLSVTKGYIGRTPEGAFENGDPVNPALLARKIRAVIDKGGWHGRNFNISLNPQAFYYRTVSLPQMNNPSLRKAIYWEALQNFPLNEEEILFDYCPLNKWPGNKDNSREYIVAATSKTTAESYTGVLDQVGLKCTALEIEPLSLFRSFNTEQPRLPVSNGNMHEDNKISNKFNVLIHIGFCSTAVLISAKKELLFYRSIKTGTDTYIGALQEIKSYSARDAEKLLFSDEKKIRSLVLSSSELLAQKIEQTINSWLDQFNRFEPALKQIHFSGGGTFIPGLTCVIERHLQVKHRIYHPLTGIEIDCAANSDNKYQIRKDIFFPVAHGLALRGWKR